jgi:hypothetical protein
MEQLFGNEHIRDTTKQGSVGFADVRRGGAGGKVHLGVVRERKGRSLSNACYHTPSTPFCVKLKKEGEATDEPEAMQRKDAI